MITGSEGSYGGGSLSVRGNGRAAAADYAPILDCRRDACASPRVVDLVLMLTAGACCVVCPGCLSLPSSPSVVLLLLPLRGCRLSLVARLAAILRPSPLQRLPQAASSQCLFSHARPELDHGRLDDHHPPRASTPALLPSLIAPSCTRCRRRLFDAVILNSSPRDFPRRLRLLPSHDTSLDHVRLGYSPTAAAHEWPTRTEPMARRAINGSRARSR